MNKVANLVNKHHSMLHKSEMFIKPLFNKRFFFGNRKQ